MKSRFTLLLTALLCSPLIAEDAPSAPAEPATTPDARFRIASANRDVATMESIVLEMEKQNAKNHSITQMQIDLMFAKKQWRELDAALVEAPATPDQSFAAHLIASRLAIGKAEAADAPKELSAKAANIFENHLATNLQTSPAEWVTLCRLHFAAGNHQAAKKSALSAVEKAKAIPQGRGKPAAFEKFSQEVHAGRMPTRDEFILWMMDPAKPN